MKSVSLIDGFISKSKYIYSIILKVVLKVNWSAVGLKQFVWQPNHNLHIHDHHPFDYSIRNCFFFFSFNANRIHVFLLANALNVRQMNKFAKQLGIFFGRACVHLIYRRWCENGGPDGQLSVGFGQSVFEEKRSDRLWIVNCGRTDAWSAIAHIVRWEVARKCFSF